MIFNFFSHNNHKPINLTFQALCFEVDYESTTIFSSRFKSLIGFTPLEAYPRIENYIIKLTSDFYERVSGVFLIEWNCTKYSMKHLGITAKRFINIPLLIQPDL